MEKRAIPGTDLNLSAIGMGCWAMGGKWWGDDVRDDESIAAVHAALDEGINWFDTAPLYGHGHADTVLRKALGKRIHEVIVATKVGVRIDGEHAESDLSPAYIVEDTEHSLERLGVECIDLLQVHWPCESNTPLGETLDALDGLRQSGKIRWYGLCNYEAQELREARGRKGMVTLQTPYSLLRREFEGSLRDVCTVEPSIGVVAYEPLCRGLLTGKFKHLPRFPETDLRSRDERFQGGRFHHARRLVDDLAKAADRLNVPTAALAVGWVAAQPGIPSAIVGAKRPEQVRDNASAARLLGRAKVWSVVDRIASIHGGWPG